MDSTTHWTTIFGDLKTDYDESDAVSDNDNVITDDEDEDEYTTCYENENLAINLENGISNVGACGDGADDNRCDDGQCCSEAGYCGPEYDGTGWINYDTDPDSYYGTEDEAFEAYCSNPKGDWRVVRCSEEPSENGSCNLWHVFVVKSLCFVFCLFCVLL